MSTAKAKQAEQAENAAEVKATGPVVYCGPTVKNTVKQYTVYADGDMLPDMMNRFRWQRACWFPSNSSVIPAKLWKIPRAQRVFFLPP